MSLFESTLTRWTTEMIELSADTTRFPPRIHSIAALGTRECELDGVVVSDPLAYRIERLGREISA